MGIGKRLKDARLAKGFTQLDLAKKIGVTSGAIGNYENETSHPKTGILLKLFEALEVDANYLWQDTINVSAGNAPSIDALNIARQYDLATEHEKSIVRATLAPYAEKVKVIKEEYAAELMPSTTELRLYTQSVAAGLGNYQDDDNYELASFVNVPSRTNIALKISGDSMKPTYQDGDIVFIETDSILQDGEIGIFNYDGNAYIKKLRLNPPRLVSLNLAYEDIVLSEDMNFFTIGRVVGKVVEL